MRRAVLGGIALLALAAGCSTPAQPQPSARQVVDSLGAVPIPSVAPGTPAPVTAAIGHPQLLAMGAPVLVRLPGNTRALVTTTGPDTTHAGGKPGDPVDATVTLSVAPRSGVLRLSAADVGCRDETGNAVRLRPIGPATASARPGHPAALTLAGHFPTGQAQLNWRRHGHVLAIWDFTVEND